MIDDIVAEEVALNFGGASGVLALVYEVHGQLNLHLEDALGGDVDHENTAELSY